MASTPQMKAIAPRVFGWPGPRAPIRTFTIQLSAAATATPTSSGAGAEVPWESVGAKASEKKATKATADAALAATILADAVSTWTNWNGSANSTDGKRYDCGWEPTVNKAVCKAVEASAPGQHFHVKPFRTKGGKAAINLQSIHKSVVFNYHVYWHETS
jgi:hypothetical protein